MIQIRRNSWHYKFYCVANNRYTPPDLCSYARGLILSGLIVMLRDALMTVVGLMLVLMIGCLIQDSGWLAVGVGAVAVSGILGLIIGAAILLVRLDDNKTKIKEKVSQYSAPRLFLEYVKAKKQKYCPKVIVVDDEGNQRA